MSKQIRIYPNLKFAENANGQRILLRRKELELLTILSTNPNRILNKFELLEVVWNYSIHAKTNTLETHISALRKKIKQLSQGPKIETIYGLGYRYVT